MDGQNEQWDDGLYDEVSSKLVYRPIRGFDKIDHGKMGPFLRGGTIWNAKIMVYVSHMEDGYERRVST